MKKLTVLWGLAGIALSAGCLVSPPKASPPDGLVGMAAARAEHAVLVDGKLDDAVWQLAPAHALSLGEDRDPTGANAVQEKGEARLAWDDAFLYIGIRFADRDVIARSDKDQDRHFVHGDVAEVFLWPAETTWYWELYVTPRLPNTSYHDLPNYARLVLAP